MFVLMLRYRLTRGAGLQRKRKGATTYFVIFYRSAFVIGRTYTALFVPIHPYAECTYSHFNSNSNCPLCNKTLGAKDFTEVVVADPSSTTEDTVKNTFQTLFTKYSATSNTLTHQEMCTRLLHSMDDNRRAVRFIFKQFVLDSKMAGQRSGNVGRAYEELKNEHTKLQQAMSSQQLEAKKITSDLQHRVQALSGSLAEMQKKIDEKDTQLNQFRSMYAAEGMSRFPPPPSSARSSSSRSIGSGHSHSAGGDLAPPPIQVFVENKKRKERNERQQAQNLALTRRGVPMRPVSSSQQQQQHYGGGGSPYQAAPPQQQRQHGGGGLPRPGSQHLLRVPSSHHHQQQHFQQHQYGGGAMDTDSIVTPIVPPPHHHRTSSAYRTSSHPGSSSSNIRNNLGAGASFTFSSRSSKRPRSGGSAYSHPAKGFGQY